MKRICLIEDEKSIVDLIKLNLELEGYNVKSINHGKRAKESLKEIIDFRCPESPRSEACSQGSISGLSKGLLEVPGCRRRHCQPRRGRKRSGSAFSLRCVV